MTQNPQRETKNNLEYIDEVLRKTPGDILSMLVKIFEIPHGFLKGYKTGTTVDLKDIYKGIEEALNEYDKFMKKYGIGMLPKEGVGPEPKPKEEPEPESPKGEEPEKGIDKVSFSVDGVPPGYEPIGDFPWSKSKIYVRDKKWISYLRREKNKSEKKRGRSKNPLVEIDIENSEVDSIIKIFHNPQLPQWT